MLAATANLTMNKRVGNIHHDEDDDHDNEHDDDDGNENIDANREQECINYT